MLIIPFLPCGLSLLAVAVAVGCRFRYRCHSGDSMLHCFTAVIVVLQQPSLTRRSLIAGAAATFIVQAPAFAAKSAPMDGLSTYQVAAPEFVGGYTVAGNYQAQGGSGKRGASQRIVEFTVNQECLCECTGTSTGVFCRGANDENAFSLVAAKESSGAWHAGQTSVGIKPMYHADMAFGMAPGGPHTAEGYFLGPNAQGEQVVFRAQQSAMGCNEGVGAAACESVCGKFGLPWQQIQRKCGL